jgi:hypothetical protein
LPTKRRLPIDDLPPRQFDTLLEGLSFVAVSGIRDSLKQQGVRLTRQRKILLDLIDQSGQHLDAERLFTLAREKTLN